MATATIQYRPDYAVPPGWVLEERLEAEGISPAELARRCGRSAKHISEIIAGKAPLGPETALQLEKVLGVNANVWLGIEASYQLHRAREAEAEPSAQSEKWIKSIPVRDLVKRGSIDKPLNHADAVSKVLAFFRVGSVSAWTKQYGLAQVAYRHSSSFKSDEAALATWRRLGELEAERQPCAEYNEARFKEATRAIRKLTREPIGEAIPQAKLLCNNAGVALALIPPLPKTALSGAAWWIDPRKAIIQLSARHKSNDHFWFSFFHEAAHIILHSKKDVFVDDKTHGDSEIEIEANEWAANTLVPRSSWNKFISTKPPNKKSIMEFAKEQGIAPGIIVGMLQHHKSLHWSQLNGLKVKLEWTTDTGGPQ